jgi:hypothetical protein
MPPHLLKNILNPLDWATRESALAEVNAAYGQALTFERLAAALRRAVK